MSGPEALVAAEMRPRRATLGLKDREPFQRPLFALYQLGTAFLQDELRADSGASRSRFRSHCDHDPGVNPITNSDPKPIILRRRSEALDRVA